MMDLFRSAPIAQPLAARLRAANLLKVMDQLAIELGVSAGDYTALLSTQGTVTQFIHAAVRDQAETMS